MKTIVHTCRRCGGVNEVVGVDVSPFQRVSCSKCQTDLGTWCQITEGYDHRLLMLYLHRYEPSILPVIKRAAARA